MSSSDTQHTTTNATTGAIVRGVVAAALVYVALYGMPKSIGPVAPVIPDQSYQGSYKQVHIEAQKMEPVDRKGLSEALLAANKMLVDDHVGLVKTTEDLQSIVLGTISYGYTSFSVSKYPSMAKEIKKLLISTVGAKVQKVDDELKGNTVQLLAELSRAIQ